MLKERYSFYVSCQAAKQFEFFVTKTPLSQVAGDFGMSQAKASLVGSMRESKISEEILEAPELVETESEGSPPSSPESLDRKSKDAFECNDGDENEDLGSEETPSAGEETTDVVKPTSNDSNISETQSNHPSVEQTYQVNTMSALEDPVKPVTLQPTNDGDLTEMEDSYAAVHKSIHDLSIMYTQQYNQDIITYAENWSKAVSDRVKARQLQFQELDKKLQHYTKKVDTLREKNNGSAGKQFERLERNELKLRGAREAYDNSGQSLILLMEELTERSWKDFFPLLMRTMSFDLSYATDMASIFVKLNNTIPNLVNIGEEHKLNPDGRLGSIETSHPEELYTGTKRMVRPVLGL